MAEPAPGPEKETVDSEVRGTVISRWSDPATWKGKIPGPGDIAKIDSQVLFDVDASVAGVIVGPSGNLLFDPAASRTLKSRGNVIVRGRLTMRPAKSSVVHLISIFGAKESAFKGGGAIPLDSDTGLWVVGSGLLDAVGSSKRPWTRAAGSLSSGTTRVTLSETPTGWRAGDEVVIAPTSSPAVGKHHAAYDTATIKSVSGRTLTLSRATKHAHPVVKVGHGRAFAAEVLNLTRNVRIEGKPEGRIHVFMNSRKKQTLRFVGCRWVGPRKGPAGGSKGVLGRYGVHFHMVGDYSRGSLVEGVVVRDAGHHAFVPHASHGVTLRQCIAHNVMEEAYWWDPGPGNATNDVLYDRCVASLVRGDPDARAFRLAGFWLGHGKGNRVKACVAAGVVGARSSSGFIWPESPGEGAPGTKSAKGDSDPWSFQDCVAHNNFRNGIFVWQNNNLKTVVDGFIGFHNGNAGVEHGAYKNSYRYQNSILYGNGLAAFAAHAVADTSAPAFGLSKVLCDGAGRTDHVILFQRHVLAAKFPTRVEGCTFRGYRKAAFGLLSSNRNADEIDVVSCSFEGNEFWLADEILVGTLLRVQDAQHGSIAVRRKDQPGQYYPQWNARVTSISKFA